MLDYKELIAKKISEKLKDVDITEIEKGIEIPPQRDMGDFAFPCFRLSKVLRKSPVAIAEELSSKLETDEYISKIEQQSGYINFYINTAKLAEEVLNEVD